MVLDDPQGPLDTMDIGVTDASAKRLMREEFAAAESSELAAWGKVLDDTVYQPQIEAEKAERAAPWDQQHRAVAGARSFRDRSGPQ